MRISKTVILIFMLIASIVTVSGFSSGRQSAYEQYIFMHAVRSGKTPPACYPLVISEQDTAGADLYESWILKRGVLEKSFDTGYSFSLKIDAEAGYSDEGFERAGSVNASLSFPITDCIHASVSAVLDTDTSKSSFYRAKPFKDAVAAAFDMGYLQYFKDNFSLLIGRTYMHSSYDISSSMIYSYDAPSLDGILMTFKAGSSIEYVFRWAYIEHMLLDSAYTLFGEESQSISRFISYHKITYSPFSFLSLSFGESALFGRTSLAGVADYAFPFFLFYAEQENASVNDNIMWEFSADWNIEGLVNLSYTLFVDDYQYEKEDIYDLEPAQLGHGLRADIPYSRGNASVSVYRINAWVYNQMFEWNRYAVRGINIGYMNAPDILFAEASLQHAIAENLIVSAAAGYTEKGDNDTYDAWIFPTDDPYYQSTEIAIAPVRKDISAKVSAEGSFNRFMPSISIGCDYSISGRSFEPSLSAGLKIFI